MVPGTLKGMVEAMQTPECEQVRNAPTSDPNHIMGEYPADKVIDIGHRKELQEVDGDPLDAARLDHPQAARTLITHGRTDIEETRPGRARELERVVQHWPKGYLGASAAYESTGCGENGWLCV